MAGFIFRSRRVFTREELVGLEGVYAEDLDPPAPVTGVGSGTILLIGEFDDGPLNVLTEIDGGDLTRQFGGLGYPYAGVPHNNACARKRSGELWNGNGFLYARFIRAQRFMVVRVDTSVGEVALTPRAILKGGKGPFAPKAGDVLSLTTSTGGPTATPAIAAAEAIATGSGAIAATGFLGGERISLQLDDSAAPLVVTFAAGDQDAAAVVTRINAAAGAAVASQAGGILSLKGLRKGSGGRLTTADVTPGALAALKLTEGTEEGTGNVGNLASVSAAELAALINNATALNTIGAKALVADDGTLSVYDAASSAGSITVEEGALATLLKLAADVEVLAGEHAAGVIPAGTRVRTAGGAEWVTMESTKVAAGTNDAPNIGPHLLKVRPAFDDGTAKGAAATAVNVLVDQPAFASFGVSNPQALTDALTEGQLDAAYIAAVEKSCEASPEAVDVNYAYCARRSIAIDTYAADRFEQVSNEGFAGRKWIRSGAIGITKAQAKADRALIASDRVWYAWPGWQLVVPEILRRGAAGGLGFSEDGVITLRSAGPLAKISALLPPEENPGQQTGLIENFFAVEKLEAPLTAGDYRDLRANGICAPRRDPTAGSIYQSGVTTDLNKARSTQARRKVADFVQDTLARLLVKYSKKIATEARRDSVVGETDSFLGGLLSAEDPARQRIHSYIIDESGNTPELEADGIFVLIVKVRSLSSLDAIEIRTEIGPGVVTVSEAA